MDKWYLLIDFKQIDSFLLFIMFWLYLSCVCVCVCVCAMHLQARIGPNPRAKQRGACLHLKAFGGGYDLKR